MENIRNDNKEISHQPLREVPEARELTESAEVEYQLTFLQILTLLLFIRYGLARNGFHQTFSDSRCNFISDSKKINAHLPVCTLILCHLWTIKCYITCADVSPTFSVPFSSEPFFRLRICRCVRINLRFSRSAWSMRCLSHITECFIISPDNAYDFSRAGGKRLEIINGTE